MKRNAFIKTPGIHLFPHPTSPNPLQTLADLISETGYVSGMAGKWHAGKEDLSHLDIPEFTGNEDVTDLQSLSLLPELLRI